MGDISGFHHHFCIGKYKDVYSMDDDTATEFLRQFRIYLWQREATANKYKVLGWNHNNIGMGILDEEDGYSEFENCDDSKGNDFIRSIIDQRNDLIAKYDSSLKEASDVEERVAQRKRDEIRENCEWYEARAEAIQEKKDEEARQKRKRMDKANAILQADLYKKKQAAKQKARQEAVYREWEENKKQFAQKK